MNLDLQDPVEMVDVADAADAADDDGAAPDSPAAPEMSSIEAQMPCGRRGAAETTFYSEIGMQMGCNMQTSIQPSV